MLKKYKNKLEEFREAVTPASSVLILTHDYPDPDCIASAYGLSTLLTHWGVESPVISFGGFVGRAENRAMIRFLGIPTIPFVLIDVGEFERVVLVDCYPGRGNVSLPERVPVHAVIDHHPAEPPADAPFFHDIRPQYGAASTIVAKYLLQSDCPISASLATALFNGIKTDTGGIMRDATADDIECYKRLFDMMDHKLLSKIENPGRDNGFFRILRKAMDSAVCYGNVGHSHLGAVTTPDCIAEMAEFFHKWERIDWMISTGIFKKQVFFSIRCSDTQDMAGVCAEKIAQRLGGSGGGHSKAAAGRVPIKDDSGADGVVAVGEIVAAMMEILGVAGERREMLL